MPGSDFNGDGRDDILWRNMQDHTYAGSGAIIPRGTITNWLATPGGGFVSNDVNAWATFMPGQWQVVGTGDFNADGRDDLLWRGDDGTLLTWLAANNGGFVTNQPNYVIVPTGWHVVGTGNFNGDAFDDILWRHDDGTFTSWIGISHPWDENLPPLGVFQDNDAITLTVLPTTWQIAGTGDFNGDGQDDILWRRDDGAFTNWLGQAPNGNFISNDANAWSLIPTYWQIVGTGDFNGDGRDDVLWRRDDGAFTEWLGQQNGGFVSNDANAWSMIPTAWTVVGTGDFNGDGRDDVAWRHSDGTFTTWSGQPGGGFVSNDAQSMAVVPDYWLVDINGHAERDYWATHGWWDY